MTMGSWGIHFERTNTWWNPGKAWMTYMARCQYLLQQGLFVADLLYFTGEDVATYTKVYPDGLNPAPPEGFDYDLINAETLLKRTKVENGRIVLPEGMSYHVFVLQNYPTVSLELLRKLRDMVNQGMVLVGAKPLKTQGLSGYTDNDAEFNRITNELWGRINGTSVTENTTGAGKVFWGIPLQTVLDKVNIKPDFEVSSRSGDAPITYIHRRIENSEVYFIANQRRTTEELVCTFRVDGKQPELWDPNTGKTTAVTIYDMTDGRVRVPVQLEPSGSVFVVFRSRTLGNHIQTITKDSKTVLATKAFPAVQQTRYEDVANTFTISL